jgi:hypothetical protein
MGMIFLLEDGRRVNRDDEDAFNFIGFGYPEETDEELKNRVQQWKKKQNATYWILLDRHYSSEA